MPGRRPAVARPLDRITTIHPRTYNEAKQIGGLVQINHPQWWWGMTSDLLIDLAKRGAALVETKNGKRALVINAIGRVFMTPFDDPFAVLNRELDACRLRQAADAIVVDFHGEASSEKQGMGFFCDGRASLVVGTHTHVPTADHQILPGGTAYMTDAGMTGDYDSIIGMQKAEPLRRFTSGIPSGRFEAAHGIATLSGVAVETDDATGLAQRIAPVRIGGRLEPALPAFWVG